ncbi:MAG: hypothetical protein LQ352_005759 [Teloschistes flavicans]|nr:MAG: hypothetical protein LQ352_005759 [Teloschistes flavicans]
MLLRSVFSLAWLFPFLIQSVPVHESESALQNAMCDDFESCSVKGLKYWNDLFSTIHTLPIYDRTDGQAIFQQHYHAEPESYMPDADISQDLLTHNVDTKHMDKWKIDSVDQTTQTPNGDDAYANAFNTNDGVIIALANWKDDDTATERLQWSELMYNCWLQAQALADQRHAKDPSVPPGGPISNLHIVIQQTVVNAETLQVLTTMYEANKLRTGSDPTWRLWDEQNTRYFFYALIGTPSVRGTLWLLNDHAYEIGGKMPVRVYTRWLWQWPDIW